MSLNLYTPAIAPIGGTSTRLITEGEKMNVVPDNSGSASFIGFLDDTLATARNGAGDVLSALAQREVNRINTGPEAATTNAGDPTDSPQNTVPVKTTFFVEHKKEITYAAMGLGGLIALALLLKL